MTYTNALGRILGRDVLNFGFAGNGKMELDVVSFLTRIDAGAFVVDCDPNMDAAAIAARAVPLVKALRAQHPAIPIILAEGTTYGADWYDTALRQAQSAKRRALKTAYDILSKAGDSHLYYVTGDQLWAAKDRLDTPTVAGTHPSDLGHDDITTAYAGILPPILARYL